MNFKKSFFSVILLLCSIVAFGQVDVGTAVPDTTKPAKVEYVLGQTVYEPGELTYVQDNRVVIECGYVKTYYGFSTNGLVFMVDNDKKDIAGTLLSFVRKDTCDNARIVVDKAVTKGIITINTTYQNAYAMDVVYGIAVKIRGAIEYWIIAPGSVPGKSFSFLPIEKARLIKFEKYDW